MNHKRRKQDTSWFILLWERYTPIVQIGSVMVAVISTSMVIGGMWKDVSAYEGRISTLEKQIQDISEIKGELHAIMNYFNIKSDKK